MVKYPKLLTQDEIAQIFQDQGEGSRLWQALDSIIDNNLLSAVSDISDPKQSAEMLSHSSGRIDSLTTLKSQIEDYKKWKNGKMNFKNS